MDATAGRVGLPAAEDQPLSLTDDLEMLARRSVEEGRSGKILDVGRRPWPEERPRHALGPVGLGDLRMADGAGAVLDVARRGAASHGDSKGVQVAGDLLACRQVRGLAQEQACERK